MNLNRREFLEKTMLAAAAAAAGSAAPRNAFADERDPFADTKDTVRLAIIGIHGRGTDLLKEFGKMKEVQIKVLCDVDEGTLAKSMKAAEELKHKPRFVQDLRRVFDDKEIDAVAIATCNHWHSLAAIWAAQAGKHAYVEKPVSHNVWEGRQMVEAARKHNRVIQSGTQRRSSEALRKAFEFLHSGKIGKVNVGRGIVYRKRESIGKKADAPVPAGVDYNLWQGPAPERPFNPNRFHYEWHWNWDYGNGELGNNGIHYLDVIRWGMKKDALPLKVLSVGGRYGYEDDGQTPNTQVVWYDYGDSQMICEVRGLKTEPYMKNSGIVFHCSDGYLAMVGETPIAFNLKGEEIEKFTGSNNHYRKFIDAVKAGKHSDPGADILQGHLSTALCHLGNISHCLGEPRPFDGAAPFKDTKEMESGAETFGRMSAHLKENGVDLSKEKLVVGKLLAFDPAAEKFPCDAAANALLTREYRKPFAVPEKV